METLIQDARYALRSLRRTLAFGLAALVTLTLGIGATTAIFTVVNATLLPPLPYPQPERLVQVMRRYASGTERAQTGLRYLFFRDHLASVSSLAAWRGPTGVNLSRGDRAAYVKATSVSKEFFDVFGVQPALGRSFSVDEDREALFGVAAGAAAAFAFARSLRTVVWGVSTGDPVTFLAVALILLLVAVMSSLIPAVRAIRLNPVAALREYGRRDLGTGIRCPSV